MHACRQAGWCCSHTACDECCQGAPDPGAAHNPPCAARCGSPWWHAGHWLDASAGHALADAVTLAVQGMLARRVVALLCCQHVAWRPFKLCCAVFAHLCCCAHTGAGASSGESADTISMQKTEVGMPGGGRGGSIWKRLVASVNYHGRNLLGAARAVCGAVGVWRLSRPHSRVSLAFCSGHACVHKEVYAHLDASCSP